MAERSELDLNMRQLPMPTPYVVGEIKVYTFEVNGQLILFDTGPPTDEARQFLRENIEIDRLSYVFITHWHPEHCGLAAFLEEETSAEIVISKYEAERLWHPERHLQQLSAIFPQLGFTADGVVGQLEHFRQLKAMVKTPARFRLLEESQELLDDLGLSYFYCPWHGGCDVIYRLQNYVISGDVILKGIFSCPCIEVDLDDPAGGRFNNYAALCGAISQMKQVESCRLLPSHRDTVVSIDRWVDFFVTKLVARTKAVAPRLRAGKTVYQTTLEFFGKQVQNPFMFYLKSSEVGLSKDFLDAPELLRQALEKNDLHDKMGYLLKV